MSEDLTCIWPLGVPRYVALTNLANAKGEAIDDFSGYSFRAVVKHNKTDADADAVTLKHSLTGGGIDVDNVNKVVSLWLLDFDDYADVTAGELLKAEILGFQPDGRAWVVAEGIVTTTAALAEDLAAPVPVAGPFTFDSTLITFDSTTRTFDETGA